MRIGVVEDDAYITDVLKETLQRLGYTPIFYPDGWSFLESLNNDSTLEPFDRMLVDVLLPGNISGHEVINYLRINRPHLPIVVISAIGSEDLKRVQKQFPGVKILHKPFHLHDLSVALETA
jgi:DNA-binding response OmpR family regulator